MQIFRLISFIFYIFSKVSVVLLTIDYRISSFPAWSDGVADVAALRASPYQNTVAEMSTVPGFHESISKHIRRSRVNGMPSRLCVRKTLQMLIPHYKQTFMKVIPYGFSTQKNTFCNT